MHAAKATSFWNISDSFLSWRNSLGFPERSLQSSPLLHHRAPPRLTRRARSSRVTWWRKVQRDRWRDLCWLNSHTTQIHWFSEVSMRTRPARQRWAISRMREGNARCLSEVARWPIQPHPLWSQGCWRQSRHTSRARARTREGREKHGRWRFLERDQAVYKAYFYSLISVEGVWLII